MRTFTGIDQLETAVGEHLGHSEWHTVTQQQIDTFADATGDHQWIHVDPERARDGPFGTTIAHGYLTLSLVPMLAAQVYALEGVRMGINYGSNKVRFPAPVPVDSRVRAGVELADVSRTESGAQVTATVVVEIDGSDRPACVAEVVSVVVA